MVLQSSPVSRAIRRALCLEAFGVDQVPERRIEG
jgi:hypothetical protein